MAKARGFYGLAPMRCCPTAIALVAFNTGEVECTAPASRTSTTSKIRSCFYSRERFTLKRRKHDFVGKVPTDSLAPRGLACGRGGMHPQPYKGRGLLPQKE